MDNEEGRAMPDGPGCQPTASAADASSQSGIPIADEWHYCGSERGGCACMMVWSKAADAPVCTVEHGEWGDSYPALRFVEGSGGRQVEAYTELMDYGTIPDEVAKTRAYLIAAAPFLYRACGEAFDFLGGVDGAADVRDLLLTAMQTAQGIEAGTGETEGLDAKRESPVRDSECAPTTPGDSNG